MLQMKTERGHSTCFMDRKSCMTREVQTWPLDDTHSKQAPYTDMLTVNWTDVRE